MRMTNGPSSNFKKQILKICKKMTSEGKHIEANNLFHTYFPEHGYGTPDKFDSVPV